MGEIADAQIDRILNMKSPAGYMPRHNKKGSNQMSNNVNNPCKVITGKCRLSYAHIWEPSSMNENSPAKYSACIIWPKTDKAMTEKVRAATEAAIQDGIKSKWKGKRPPESKLKLPMRDGDEERPEDEAFQGCYFINANSNKRPGVVDLARNPILENALEIVDGFHRHEIGKGSSSLKLSVVAGRTRSLEPSSRMIRSEYRSATRRFGTSITVDPSSPAAKPARSPASVVSTASCVLPERGAPETSRVRALEFRSSL